jgi:hypothetical protein
MTIDTDSSADSLRDEMGDILSRVRQIDPTNDEAAVRGYVREMVEADAVLDIVDLEGVPLLTSFIASWQEGLAH